MPTDIVMPQMGESIFEGTITRWLKKVGDPVQKDEPLFEISTDKVDAEIPSPAAGVLIEIKHPEGATVQVNTVVAVVGEAGSQGVAVVPAAADRVPAAAKPAAAVPVATAPAAAKPVAQSPGSVEIVMPQMGESIFEGTITKWLKKVGDSIQKDEPIFEISTDKVDAEIPSTVAGTLIEIMASEGETVGVNTVVARIGSSSSAVVPVEASQTEKPKAAPVAKLPASAAPGAPIAPPANTPTADTAPVAATGAAAKLRSSPLVRRIARENNLDLTRIAGTGSAGRITKQDVEQYLAAKGPGHSDSPAAEALPASPSPLLGTLVPLSRMRSIIAQRMVESMAISPHVHSVYKVDMTRIVHLRQQQKSAYEQKNGVRLTYMPFIAAAAIQALIKFPILNSSLEGGSIRYHQNIHLGIAVALDWGLIVPVIRNAEQRDFVSLARTIADLAERARSKKLKPEEASGSTFTLTNSGIFGDEFATPIINQPESAILAIAMLKKEPVVLTDSDGNDSIAIRSMQHFCLGFDHRTIDGADAGKFMSEFKRTLETWDKPIG